MPALGTFVLALTLGPSAPEGDSADPSSLYMKAVQLRESGDFAGAARAYARAHEILRATDLDHSNVLDSLFEALEGALDAHARSSDVSLLCEGLTLVRSYEAALVESSRPAVPEVAELGGRAAAAVESAGGTCEVVEDESTGSDEAPPPTKREDTPPPEVRPEGPPQADVVGPELAPRNQRLRVGGYASLGVASLGLVALVAGAATGAARRVEGKAAATDGESAGWLQDNVIADGRASNTAMLVGAAVAGAATIAAVTLLATSRRSSRTMSRVRVTADGVRF